MWLKREWRYARKRWSWEIEDFEKESVESWLWTMQADNWVSAIEAVEPDHDVEKLGSNRTVEVGILRLDHGRR